MVRTWLIAAMFLCAATAQSGCAEAQPQRTAAAAAPISFETSGDAAFDAWRADFAGRALASGRPRSAVAEALAGLTPDPLVIERDRNQPEFVRAVWDYIERAVTPGRIEEGRRLRAARAAAFEPVEAAYGVDADIVAGIWALETSFGQAPLPHEASRAIATLAFEGRRRERFEAYLLALIDMIAAGYAREGDLRSSWAGALGQPQFMPDVYLTDAIDWDGDGRRDIWRQDGDIFASISNYLLRRGWRTGEPVFEEARLPAGFDYARADGSALPISAWAALGVAPFAAAAWPDTIANLKAELFLPAGAEGPALLLFDNFRAIRAYNPSDRYALAVALLARGFEGRSGVQARWPREQGVLQKAQMQRVQELLRARGHDPGAADGVFGSRTRAAVRAYQAQAGIPADGWPTPALLARLRQEAGPQALAQEQADSPALDTAGIERLQRALAALGAPIGRPTGSVGPRTRAAIEDLERELGLPTTGRASAFILAQAQSRLTGSRGATSAPHRR